MVAKSRVPDTNARWKWPTLDSNQSLPLHQRTELSSENAFMEGGALTTKLEGPIQR